MWFSASATSRQSQQWCRRRASLGGGCLVVRVTHRVNKAEETSFPLCTLYLSLHLPRVLDRFSYLASHQVRCRTQDPISRAIKRSIGIFRTVRGTSFPQQPPQCDRYR